MIKAPQRFGRREQFLITSRLMNYNILYLARGQNTQRFDSNSMINDAG